MSTKQQYSIVPPQTCGLKWKLELLHHVTVLLCKNSLWVKTLLFSLGCLRTQGSSGEVMFSLQRLPFQHITTKAWQTSTLKTYLTGLWSQSVFVPDVFVGRGGPAAQGWTQEFEEQLQRPWPTTAHTGHAGAGHSVAHRQTAGSAYAQGRQHPGELLTSAQAFLWFIMKLQRSLSLDCNLECLLPVLEG